MTERVHAHDLGHDRRTNYSCYCVDNGQAHKGASKPFMTVVRSVFSMKGKRRREHWEVIGPCSSLPFMRSVRCQPCYDFDCAQHAACSGSSA